MITKAFNALASTGRASAFQAVAVRMVRDSAVSLTEGARIFLRSILHDVGFGVMREDAVVQWEHQFGIIPAPTDTLAERQDAIEEAWALSGAQGPGYIQARLQAAGYDVVVTENFTPIADLVTALGTTFSSTDGSFTSDEGTLVFGQNTSGYLLGNGRLSLTGGGVADPIEIPGPGEGTAAPTFGSSSTLSPNFGTTTFGNDTNRWGYVFIIEGESETKANIPSQKREAFEKLVVQLKPAHLGVLLRVNFT